MESNWIEIKRFLNDYKKIIGIGAVFISLVFTLLISVLESKKIEEQPESETNIAVEEILDDASPAYYQVYLEFEDGTEFGNTSIVEEYFNRRSVRKDLEETTQINLNTIEENLYNEIKVIRVERDSSSYLWTASFNSGNEQTNLDLADYYYKLLLSDEIDFLRDKKIFVFEEPVLAGNKFLSEENQEQGDTTEQFDGRKEYGKRYYLKNTLVGFILGLVAMIGVLLLKVIYGRKLEYSFAYAQEKEDEFVLLDEKLDNKELISHFIAAPYATQKVILSEHGLSDSVKRKLTQLDLSSFESKNQQQTKLTEFSSFAKVKDLTNISEIIIVVQSTLTNRKWYKNQMEFAELNNLPVKIIQINP